LNTTIIRQRVADFLKAHAPFDHVQNEDLLQLASSGRIAFHEAEEFIFRQGEARGPLIWVIQQGKVEVLEESPAGEQLRDLLGEGDLLGLGRFLHSPQYLHSARTASDVMLYGLEALAFQEMVERYPSMGQFLDVQLSAIKRYSKTGAVQGRAKKGRLDSAETSWLDEAPPPTEFLARRLAAFGVVGDEPTVRAGESTESHWMRLLESRAKSLLITEEGTPAGQAVGLLRAPDLSLWTGRDPAALLEALETWCLDADRPVLIERARVLVSDALSGPWAVDRCARLDAIFESAAAANLARLAEAEAGAPGAASWLGFGVMGRGEGLRELTPEWAPRIGGVLAGGREEYAEALAEAVRRRLPVGAEAPRVAALEEWKTVYSELIDNPVMNSIWENRVLLDLRGVSGDGAAAEELAAHIAGEIAASKGFVRILANDTLAQLPQLTFFEEFVIDLDGGTHRTLDLGAAAIDPIVDAARIFALAQGELRTTHTLGRLDAAARAMPEAVEVLQDAAEAFRIACWLRARHGRAEVEPGALDKYDRWLLRRVFAAIHGLLEFTGARWGLA